MMAYQNLHSHLKEEIWKCNINPKDVKMTFKYSFWREVLEAWAAYNFEPEDEIKPCNIGCRLIWFNSNIRINNKLIWYRKPYESGLATLNQLINLDSGLINSEIICEMFQLTIMGICVECWPLPLIKVSRSDTCVANWWTSVLGIRHISAPALYIMLGLKYPIKPSLLFSVGTSPHFHNFEILLWIYKIYILIYI